MQTVFDAFLMFVVFVTVFLLDHADVILAAVGGYVGVGLVFGRALFRLTFVVDGFPVHMRYSGWEWLNLHAMWPACLAYCLVMPIIKGLSRAAAFMDSQHEYNLPL